MRRIPDYTLEQCVALIVQYQVDREPEVFHQLLAQFDRLLVVFIMKILAYEFCLRKIPKQELYHSAVIGLHRALLKIPQDVIPKLVPYWIKSYVKVEIFATYRHILREREYSITHASEVHTDDLLGYETASARNPLQAIHAHLLYESIMEADILSLREKKVLKMHYIDGMEHCEIAPKLKISYNYVRVCVYRIKKKLQKYFELEEDGKDR